MNDWINLSALWKIVVIGLLAGAGLPAIFAVGLRALAITDRARPHTTTIPSGGVAVEARTNPVGLAAAGLCFAVVLAAIGYGIYLIVAGT